MDSKIQVGDIVIRKDRGREIYLVIESRYTKTAKTGWDQSFPDEQEITILDCETNRTKDVLARFYCIFLAS